MEYKLYKDEDVKTSRWTGGITKQLAIFPLNGDYLERQFVWRLSSATCELEESDFSKLPDFNRVLVVLEGDVVLAHDGVRVARLSKLEQDRFDGAYRTKSFGKITDYNLMVAKGNEGFIDVMTLNQEPVSVETERHNDLHFVTQAFFCQEGYATVTINDKMVMVKPGQQLVINFEQNEKMNISVMGEGTLIHAHIYYNYSAGELGPEEIPPEKTTFSDFLTCMYLANTQFRGAKFIVPGLKSKWCDEKLSEAIHKVEKIYLNYFVFLLGLAIVAFSAIGHVSTGGWVLLLLGWLLVDMVIVSPLIYLAVVPKPVKKHIKDIANLTPYERKVMEEQAKTNERLDRLLRKYSFTGRAQYDEDGNRTDELKWH